jgi:hypothetical protein
MRHVQSIGLLAISGMCLGLGCQIIAGLDKDVVYDPTYFSSSSSGTGGTGGAGGMNASSSSGMGGAGGNAECSAVSDCNATECKSATACTDGVCIWTFTPDNTVLESQLYGDCLIRKCDGKGGIKEDPNFDFKDKYDWKNPCYVNDCNAPANPMLVMGATCTTPWGVTTGTCVADFKCIECTLDTDCASMKCFADKCVAPTCGDATQNGSETDVDCGGDPMQCVPCTEGKKCLIDSDCDGKCDPLSLLCVAPSCGDGLRNQDETGIDCGGKCAKLPTPQRCADFALCLYPDDCASGVCLAPQCQQPSCTDQTKNKDEEGIDCGGTCPLACP